MNIDRNNYEIYFIDFFEGNLNPEEKEHLRNFLSDNPDLKKEFDEFEKYDVAVPEGEYKFKNDLLKSISDLGQVSYDNIDEYSIAFLENDLNDSEKHLLLDTVHKNADFEKIFKLYQKTRLQPDESLKYIQKNQLKHFVIERKLVLRMVSFASAAAIIVLGFFLVNPSEDIQQNRVEISKIMEAKNKVETANNDVTKVIEENNLEINAKIPEEKVEGILPQGESEKTENQELIVLKKLETRTISLNNNQGRQSILISNRPEITNETAVNTTQPVIETQQEIEKNSKENRKIILWSIAEMGLKVIGKLNETNLDVETNFSNSGQLKSVTFITEKRKITTPAI